MDFTDLLALPSHTHEKIHVKTNNVAEASASREFNIYKGKTNILKYNTENTNPITLHGETLDGVRSFTYLPR